MPGMKSYFEHIQSYPLLTKEEEKELGKRAINGDAEAINRLVESNLRLVVLIASQFKNKSIEFEELISLGNLGLMRAAKKYNVENGTKFSTYAALWIKAFIRINLKKFYNKIESRCVSTEDSVFTDKNGDCVRVIDTIPDNSSLPIDNCIKDERNIFLDEIIDKQINSLSERDKDIFIRRNGLFGCKPEKLKSIAARWGLTEEGVRIIAKAISDKIKSKMQEMNYVD